MTQKQLSEKALRMRRLYTEGQAGEYIGGVSAGTMAKWRTQGGGPKFIRVSSNPKSMRADVRYDGADLDDWLDERRFSSTSDASLGDERPVERRERRYRPFECETSK